MFQKIGIVGLGLIGSSICRALQSAQPRTVVVGYDADPDVRQIAREIGFCDGVCDALSQAVEDVDLLIIATPVFEIGRAVAAAAPHLKAGAIVSDVGSVKAAPIADILRHLPDGNVLVPTHPMAGTEHSGPAAGFASLFDDKWCFIVEHARSPDAATRKVERLWASLGANTKRIEASEHDEICALVSHVPHLIAFAMMGAARDVEDHRAYDMLRYSSSGFRDFTRIAASDATMWRDIFMGNRFATLDILSQFEDKLAALKETIISGEDVLLHTHLDAARNSRKLLL